MPLIGSIGAGNAAEKDFSSFIEKAVQAKSKPIELLQKNQELYQKKSLLLREIKADLIRIQAVAKSLYGLNTVMGQLICTSSDPNSLQAMADKTAKNGSYTLQILSLAKGQKIRTTSISSDKKIPTGEFSLSVGQETFHYYFLGGFVEDLVTCINTLSGTNPLFAEAVRIKSDEFFIVITSTKSGEDNPITLEQDTSGVLRSVGLFSGNKENVLPILNRDTDLSQIETRDSEKKIQLSSPVLVDPKYFLQVIFSNIKKDTLPFRWIIIGKDSVSEKFMELSLADALVVEQGPPQKKRMQVGLSNHFSEITSVETISVRAEEGVLHEVSLVTPGDSQWNQPKNIVIPCTDAKILYNDILIQREQNEVKDIIPFVTLSLKAISPNPVIVEVKANKDLAMDSFVEFLYLYNQLVEKINLVTSIVPLEQAEAEWSLKEEQKSKYAVLQNEDYLREILYEFYKFFSKKYVSSSTSKIHLSTQIGVKLVFRLEGLRGLENGKVEFDPQIYTGTYENHTGEVRSFFGFDANGDKIVDSGFAYEVFHYLNKYVSRNGLLDTKAASYDAFSKLVGEKIQQKQKGVEEFRKKQERDFSKLEGLQKGMKDMQRLLDSLSPKD